MKMDPGAAPPPVRGFRFSGVHGGLKPKGRRDFALIVADRPAVCAALFTRNRAAAPPVAVAREHAAGGRCQAVMINSGNANAGTGEKGLKFVHWSCRELGSRLSIEPELVIPCSTGVIGVEIDKIPFSRAISLAIDGLSRKGLAAAARAIMTSDAFPKWAFRTARVGQAEVAVAGMAKGAGMIHPNMATTLGFVVTDADLSQDAASKILAEAIAASFNRISVDGDTSTNDTLVLLASGEAAGGRIETRDSDGYAAVAEAVTAVCDDLARMVVRDGEGATKMVDIVVEGLADAAEAERVAETIAKSVLVKSAFAGADPNWGRLLMAAGNSGVDFDPDKVAVRVDDVVLVRDGAMVSQEARRMAKKVMRQDAYTLTLVFGKGSGRAVRVTSDLTEAYVRFNSAYTS
jgi:glutamate N-acetyltransferase/amino-acid N-acetyltransferase